MALEYRHIFVAVEYLHMLLDFDYFDGIKVQSHTKET
jgi:hypothetical protein